MLISVSAGAPSTKTNTKIAITKMIELHPQMRMIHSITGSLKSSIRASPRLIEGRPRLRREYPELARLIALSHRDRLFGERNEANILHDLLSIRPVAPIDEIFHHAGRLAGGVNEKRPRDRIAAVDGALDARGDASLAFFLGNLQRLHIGSLVARAAVADRTRRLGHQ